MPPVHFLHTLMLLLRSSDILFTAALVLPKTHSSIHPIHPTPTTSDTLSLTTETYHPPQTILQPLNAHCGGFSPNLYICSKGLYCDYSQNHPLVADAPGTCIPDGVTRTRTWTWHDLGQMETGIIDDDDGDFEPRIGERGGIGARAVQTGVDERLSAQTGDDEPPAVQTGTADLGDGDQWGDGIDDEVWVSGFGWAGAGTDND
ncbi:hypothetical protein HK097_005734 [Rhizophlyctis rosea]|uniref:Uncharacterized protein n=1 Tax=Rhizophlyctis rosea TaxID=64517 RepID=A0AAD5X6Q7_9FUNG|nr:hypothetical protein HK097_005734 [Rhizophlyctis rosea]